MPTTELVRWQWRQTANSQFPLIKKQQLNSDAKSCLSGSKLLSLSAKSHLALHLLWISFFYSICCSKDENIQFMSAVIHVQTRESCVNNVTFPYSMIQLEWKLKPTYKQSQTFAHKSYGHRRWEQLSSAHEIYGRRAEWVKWTCQETDDSHMLSEHGSALSS